MAQPNRQAAPAHGLPDGVFITLETLINDAKSLNFLAAWIGAARDFIDDIGSSANIDPRLCEVLKRNKCAAYGPDWTDEEQCGRGLVHLRVWELLGEIEAKLREVQYGEKAATPETTGAAS